MFEDDYLDTFMEDRLSGGGDWYDHDDLAAYSDNEAWLDALADRDFDRDWEEEAYWADFEPDEGEW